MGGSREIFCVVRSVAGHRFLTRRVMRAPALAWHQEFVMCVLSPLLPDAWILCP